MRIAIGQLWQETNTFNPLATCRQDFEDFGVIRGPAIVEQMAQTNELGGFIQTLQKWPEQPEIVGLVRLPAWPSGPASPATFDWLRDELVSSLKRAGNVDGVLLALHGAMAAESHPDVEGEILTILRQHLGQAVPLVVSLDLHANITRLMLNHADVLVLYHTMPHVDIFSTGVRAASILRRLMTGARACTAIVKVPGVFPAERANTQSTGTFAERRKCRLIECEQDPRILTAGIATVQPWLDVPELGSAVIVTTDNDPKLAMDWCRRLAVELWDSRTDYLPELVSIEDAVRGAFSLSEGLTVLSDAADATTSGAPGDSVWILKELLRYEWTRSVLVTLVSPEIVSQAEQIGEGANLETRLGGVRDSRFGTRISVRAIVERLFRAQFVLSGHIGTQLPIDMGPSASLRMGNIHVIVTTRSGPHFAPELFRCAGLDPFAAAVLVAKSPCGFRAAYEASAKQILSVRAPGCAPSNFWDYSYQHLPTPTWPWHPVPDWHPEPTIKEPTST